MAPLSHDIAGVILKHDTFGTHLDAKGKTIDDELEEKNFFAAASVLLLSLQLGTSINDVHIFGMFLKLPLSFVQMCAFAYYHERQVTPKLEICIDAPLGK